MNKDVEEIITRLELHKESIILILTRRCWEHFNGYSFIMRNIAELFDKNSPKKLREDFSWFYDMNGHFGLNQKQKEKFFELLVLEEKELTEILDCLHQIPPRRLHLSFATKLLHTLDNKLPIYDSHIADVLFLPLPTYPNSVNERIQQRIMIYDILKKCFSDLLNEEAIEAFLQDLRATLKSRAKSEHFLWHDKLISKEKLLDSALWALYTVENSK